MSPIAPETFGPLSDATLLSLAWKEDGRDLVIELASGNRATRRFIFTWVDHLSVSIDQKNGPSQPLSWDGSAEQLTNGRVRVLLDFAHQGAISFECDQITADGP